MSRDEYSEAGTGMVKATVPLLLALVALFAFYARWAGWMSDKVFSPREEQVRRETFKQSQAYNDGMAQDLDRMFVRFCPFCGTPAPALRPRKRSPAKVSISIDGGYYCSTCSKDHSCKCAPPELLWEPVS